MSKLQLHLPKPCSEKWEQMQPTSQGGFCELCQKEVVDFTAMTDQKLAAYLSRNKAGCGRFKAKQLYKTLSNGEDKHLLWKKWLLALLVSTGLPAVAYSQGKPVNKPDTTQSELKFSASTNKDVPVSTQKKFVNSGQLKGVVRDSTSKELLPGVAIHLGSNKEGVVSDIDGVFILETEMLQEQDIVYFNYIGYKDISISISELRKDPEVLMAEDLEALSEVVMVGGYHTVRWYTPRGMWWRIKGLFRRH